MFPSGGDGSGGGDAMVAAAAVVVVVATGSGGGAAERRSGSSGVHRPSFHRGGGSGWQRQVVVNRLSVLHGDLASPLNTHEAGVRPTNPREQPTYSTGNPSLWWWWLRRWW